MAIVRIDGERLGRFYAVATRIGAAQTVDEVLNQVVHGARALVDGDGAVLRLLDERSGTTRFSAGGRGRPATAVLERDLLVGGRPYATLRVMTSRRRFTAQEEARIELLCMHGGLAVERVALRGREEILEQVRELLGAPAAGAAKLSIVREVGDLRLDLSRYEVSVGGARVHVTPSEFRLLELLTEEPGRAYSRREIVERLWQSEYAGNLRVADAHVARLRRKLEREPRHPERLLQVRGVGYKLVSPTA